MPSTNRSRPPACTAEEARVLREAFAGMIWGKQFFAYSVKRWQDGDAGEPAPPQGRAAIRNRDVASPQRPRRHLHA